MLLFSSTSSLNFRVAGETESGSAGTQPDKGYPAGGAFLTHAPELLAATVVRTPSRSPPIDRPQMPPKIRSFGGNPRESQNLTHRFCGRPGFI